MSEVERARSGAPSLRATLSGEQRLKTQRHFRHVYQRGRRAAGQWMTVVAMQRRARPPHAGPDRANLDKAPAGQAPAPTSPAPKTPAPKTPTPKTPTPKTPTPKTPTMARLGVSVSKDHGGAVRRNKLKRLLREAFRLERHQFPADLDLVLIPRQRPEDFPLVELRRELVRLVQRLGQPDSYDRRGAPRRR